MVEVSLARQQDSPSESFRSPTANWVTEQEGPWMTKNPTVTPSTRAFMVESSADNGVYSQMQLLKSLRHVNSPLSDSENMRKMLLYAQNFKHPWDSALIPSLWWSMVVAASCYRGASQWQGQGDWSELREGWMQPNTERSLKKTCSRVHDDSPFTWQWPEAYSQDSALEWLSVQVSDCPWVAQPKPRLKPHVNICEDGSSQTLLIAIWRSDLRGSARKNGINYPKSRCAKLVWDLPKKTWSLNSCQGASPKYWIKGLNTYERFQS